MTSHYFKLLDDVYLPERWELEGPVDQMGRKIGTQIFRRGIPARVQQPIQIPLAAPGKALDFSFMAEAPIPVVHARVAALLSELAPRDVQLIPAQVEGQTEPYFLVNITRVVRCIDDENSDEVIHREPEQRQAENDGEYRLVIGLRIDPTQVGDAQIFMTWGWVAIIVSQAIKEALENLGASGTRFELVTGPSRISPEERERDRRSRELLETADTARATVWRTLGQLDEDLSMPMAMNSAWPGHRQLWGVIRRPSGNTLLVTQGLSDPFIETLEPSVGFGLELLLEVDASVKDISKGWPLLLLGRVAETLAEQAPIREAVKGDLVSLEVSGKGLPKSLVTEDGTVAVLLGLESRTLPVSFTNPYGEVRLVPVKLLLPAERTYLVEHGAQGPSLLARRFAEKGEEHLSRPRRKSVV